MVMHAAEKNKTEKGDRQCRSQDEWFAVLNRVVRRVGGLGGVGGGGPCFKVVWPKQVEESGPRHCGGSLLGLFKKQHSVAKEEQAREQGQGSGSRMGCHTGPCRFF